MSTSVPHARSDVYSHVPAWTSPSGGCIWAAHWGQRYSISVSHDVGSSARRDRAWFTSHPKDTARLNVYSNRTIWKFVTSYQPIQNSSKGSSCENMVSSSPFLFLHGH